MYTINDLYNAAFIDKLTTARHLYTMAAAPLLRDKAVRTSLEKLNKCAENLQSQMVLLSLPGTCGDCGSKEGGGCCSVFMANENDALQLLINMLAGCHVEIQRQDEEECYLLGPQGCVLHYKPMFCLNYNCRTILTKSDEPLLTAMKSAAASLLQVKFLLEQLLLSELKKMSVIS